MPDFKNYKFENLVLAEKITNILTEAILKGEIKCGEQLVELEYQKIFNISRSPIREAFRKLEKMNIVEIIPRKGTFVKVLSRKDIVEHFPVRASLEGLAAKLAYINKDDIFLKSLEEKLKGMEGAAQNHNSIIFWKEHAEFHEIFIEKSENAILRELLNNLRTQNIWFHFTYKYFEEDLQRTCKEHNKILNMYLAADTDTDELEKFVKHHIELAKDNFLQYLHDI